MSNEPEIKFEEVGTMPVVEQKVMPVEEALYLVNGDLGRIVGKIYELFPIDVASMLANDIGLNMGTIRNCADALKKEKQKIANEAKQEEKKDEPDIELITADVEGCEGNEPITETK